METWKREDLPYDAMGDFSMFEFENGKDSSGTEKESHIVKMKPQHYKCCSLHGNVFRKNRNLNNISWPV